MFLSLFSLVRLWIDHFHVLSIVLGGTRLKPPMSCFVSSPVIGVRVYVFFAHVQW